MRDWYSRPGGYHDRANVSVRRLALMLVAAGVLMAVLFVVIFGLLGPLLFANAPR